MRYFLVFIPILFMSCNRQGFSNRLLSERAPDVFQARFETTKGDFEIEAHRAWSPLAVDRLYQLIKSGYYTDVPVYRLVPNYVVQWGGVDTKINNKWEAHPVPDEPVLQRNEKGIMSFARDGAESRNYTLFINLKDNSPRLDTIMVKGITGYPPVARVTKGFGIVSTFFYYDWKNEVAPKMDTSKNYAALFKSDFPRLDRIKKAYLLR